MSKCASVRACAITRSICHNCAKKRSLTTIECVSDNKYIRISRTRSTQCNIDVCALYTPPTLTPTPTHIRMCIFLSRERCAALWHVSAHAELANNTTPTKKKQRPPHVDVDARLPWRTTAPALSCPQSVVVRSPVRSSSPQQCSSPGSGSPFTPTSPTQLTAQR